MTLTDKEKIQKLANSIARKNGFGMATDIIINKEFKSGEGRVVGRVDYGYRKWTTGEYVPNSYRLNFGWKNTYYQSAKTVVAINPGF